MTPQRPRTITALAVALLAFTLAGCSAPPAPEPTADTGPVVTTASVGDRLESGGWAATIEQVTFAADATVAAANEFNPAPQEGEQYALARITLERTAQNAAIPLDVGFTLTVGGEAHPVAAAVTPEPLNILAEIPAYSETTGTLAFLVPAAADTGEVTVAVSGGSEVFFVKVP